MSKGEIIKFLILRSIGNFLLLVAIFGVIATFGPAIMEEIQFRVALARGVHFTVGNPVNDIAKGQGSTANSPASPSFANILSGPQEQVITAVDTNFSIVIPKIGASAKVFPNVDPANPDEFLPILLKGVAHAKGSVFPGYKGTTYLFAHSTDNWWDVGRYNAVFYLLKDLQPGDKIVIFFEGKRFDYSVEKNLITDADDTSLLENSHDTPEQLVLQTCWPPGTAWKRLFVVATPVK